MRGYSSEKICAVVVFVLYFLYINIVLKKHIFQLRGGYILSACLIGCSLLQVLLRIIWPLRTLGTLPDFLFHLLGIVLGYMFYFSNRNFRIIILAFSFSSCSFLYFKGYSMWFNKLSFNTFTGIIKEDNQEYNLMFQTNTGDTLSLSNFKSKYLLLDCWYTYCGGCYKKMPEMQQLYDDYKQNPEISMYAMHSFMKETIRNDPPENYTTGSEIVEKKGFSFPCLSIDIDNPVLKELGVNVYPTVLIFDKQSNLIFRGNIKNAKNRIKKLLKENGT